MSVSEAFHGVVDESAQSMELAPPRSAACRSDTTGS